MKPIPEDTGSFYDIRTANPQMLYVDKTAYLHRLVSSSRKCLFLSRPRRFGEGAAGVRPAMWDNRSKMKLVPGEVVL